MASSREQGGDGPATPEAPGLPGRMFRPVLLALLAAVFLAHLPSLRAPHHEGDETVFTFLAERLREDPSRYTVRGALEGDAARRFVADIWIPAYAGVDGGRAVAALERLDRVELLVDPLSSPPRFVLDPAIYDHPVFIHPPIYPLGLTFFRIVAGPYGGPLLSILVHVAAVFAVAVLGRRWIGPLGGIVAGGLLGIDPVSWLAGSHVWADGMLELAVTLAVLAAVAALASDRAVAALGAGAVFGIACLTKYPAIVVAPALCVAAVLPPRSAGARKAALFVGGAAALVVPWIVFFRASYGAWLPVTRPTPWLMETYPYVELMAARPWHFYLTGLLCVAPVFAFAAAGVTRVKRDPALWIPVTWAAGGIVLLTILGITGHGMQLRYLAPVMPALCLLAAAGILRVRRVAWYGAAALLALATAVTSLQNTRNPDPFPTFLVARAHDVGIPVERLLRGLW